VKFPMPKYATDVSNITMTFTEVPGAAFSIDILNDGIIDIGPGANTSALNMTPFLQSCVPNRRGADGMVCLVPINITASLGLLADAATNMTISYTYANVPWKATGTESKVTRANQSFYDLIDAVGIAKRAKTGKLQHNSIVNLQNLDQVTMYATDQAGNRNGNLFNLVISAAPTAPAPVVLPVLPSLSLSGFLDCVNQKASVTTSSGASITITKASGEFVTGGSANMDGVFEFQVPASGTYSVSASKTGFNSSTISLTAHDCTVTPPITTNKTKLNCLPGDSFCSFVIEMTTNKLFDFSINVSSFVPKSMFTELVGIIDRTNKAYSLYSFTDSTVIIPAKQTETSPALTSEFSLIMKAVITAAQPTFNATENKAVITLVNPQEDITVDELTVPLPPEAIGKNISSVEYVPAGGTPINITSYVVVNDTIIIKQPVNIRRI